MKRFRLRPSVRHWLQSPDPAPDPESPGAEDPWGAWLLGRMAAGAILDIGGVLVDRAVLEQRFRCVPARCAPQAGRGRLRSCCADLDVALSTSELGRLRRHTRRLWDWLLEREPRLGARRPDPGGLPFWLAADGAHLSRPGARCVFSALDRRGRIRCHLHAYARARGVDLEQVQPLPCRLFPLVLVELPTGAVALTTLYRRTTGLVGTCPASRFPCLTDRSHPALTRSAARELNWLFGSGFAAALRAHLPPAGAAGTARNP